MADRINSKVNRKKESSMDTFSSLSATLQALEEDLARQQQAVDHLRAALRLISDGNGMANSTEINEVEEATSPTSRRDGVSQLVDQYIASIPPGNNFQASDAVQAVVDAGNVPWSESLRANVSSVLSRRVKSNAIERVGGRGSFVKPKVLEEQKNEEPPHRDTLLDL